MDFSAIANLRVTGIENPAADQVQSVAAGGESPTWQPDLPGPVGFSVAVVQSLPLNFNPPQRQSCIVLTTREVIGSTNHPPIPRVRQYIEVRVMRVMNQRVVFPANPRRLIAAAARHRRDGPVQRRRAIVPDRRPGGVAPLR